MYSLPYLKYTKHNRATDNEHGDETERRQRRHRGMIQGNQRCLFRRGSVGGLARRQLPTAIPFQPHVEVAQVHFLLFAF